MTEQTKRTRAFKEVRAKQAGTALSSQPSRRGKPWLLLALAASLIVCIALGALSLAQHHKLQAAASPRLNPLLLDLDPEGVGLRGGQNEAKIPLSASSVVLILNLFEPKGYSRYAMDIMDQQGRVLWPSTAIQPTEVGNFTVALPQGFPPVSCSIRLFGVEAERQELLATYRLDPADEETP